MYVYFPVFLLKYKIRKLPLDNEITVLSSQKNKKENLPDTDRKAFHRILRHLLYISKCFAIF